MMHSLYSRPSPTPTLYVRSLASWAGPEYSLSRIFTKARHTAPCLLVFEDLDSIVTDAVRSYFLNEVDGLRNNDGILMVGSTNHLERLDPGISKRPSRFDRKYLFPDPDLRQRVRYCTFWRGKLEGNEDVEFPARLCEAVAAITKGFSFAYIQEAFVAALLAIANGDADGDDDDDRDGDVERKMRALTCACDDPSHMTALLKRDVADDGDLDRYVLWREIKKVVKTLREELESEKEKGADYGCWMKHGSKFDD
jgi:transitional endoplasmic reticulum ATPase